MLFSWQEQRLAHFLQSRCRVVDSGCLHYPLLKVLASSQLLVVAIAPLSMVLAMASSHHGTNFYFLALDHISAKSLPSNSFSD